MARLRFNTGRVEEEINKKLNELQFQKGESVKQTEHNIERELKRSGISPNMQTVRKLAKKMHDE